LILNLNPNSAIAPDSFGIRPTATAEPGSEFHLVWNPQGGHPTHKHADKVSAEREAERLAKQKPGQFFYVLKAEGVRFVDSMNRIDFAPAEELRLRMTDGDGPTPF
jgi:hypothetical protein